MHEVLVCPQFQGGERSVREIALVAKSACQSPEEVVTRRASRVEPVDSDEDQLVANSIGSQRLPRPSNDTQVQVLGESLLYNSPNIKPALASSECRA